MEKLSTMGQQLKATWGNHKRSLVAQTEARPPPEGRQSRALGQRRLIARQGDQAKAKALVKEDGALTLGMGTFGS